MTENFANLKQELLEYHERLKQEDEIEKEFNALTNNQTLKSLCERMQKDFPKNPSLQDVNAMIYVYSNLNDNSINEKDREDWAKQLNTFSKICPDNYEDQKRLHYTMASLKKANLSSKTTYSIGKKIVEKLTANSPFKQSCEDFQFENADNYHKHLLTYAQDDKKFATYQEQTNAYKKAANILLEIKPTIRWSRYNDFSKHLCKHYMQSEWGKANFAYDNQKVSKKVFASLPLATKQAIKSNKSKSDFWAR